MTADDLAQVDGIIDRPGHGIGVIERRLARGSALAVAALAAFGWVAFVLGQWRVATFGATYVPMAPLTAQLFILLSAASVLASHRPSRSATRVTALVGVGAVALIGALVGAQFVFGFTLPVEQWLAGAAQSRGEIPVGRMAPLTALCFLLAAGAVGCQVAPLAGHAPFQRASLALAVTLLLLSLLIIAGYATGTPLSYGTRSIPMALLTAVAFLLLSVGALVEGGGGAYLRRLREREAPEREDAASRRMFRDLMGLFGLVALVIVVVGTVVLRQRQDALRTEIEAQLAAVEDLKVAQLVEWRRERLRDGRQLFYSRTLQEDMASFLTRPNSAQARDRLARWLTLMLEGDTYRSAMVFDGGLHRRLSAGGQPAAMDPPDGMSRRLRAAAPPATDVTLSDLQRGAGGDIFMEFIIPVASATTDRPALIVFRIDAEQFLFPLIQRWPFPSPSGETLLARRDGDSVLYLNTLRHRTGTAMVLRQPIDEVDLPVAMAVRGVTGTHAGIDYRGVPVLAAIRAVPESPWVIVAKVDQAEIFGPLRRQAATAFSLIGVLVVSTLLATILLWRQRAAEERKQRNVELEGRVRERTRQLDAANQELQAFAHSVSHDLRAPLRGVDGWSLALIEDFGDQLDQPALGYLHTIRSETQRMGQLIDDLLVLSRIAQAAVTRVPLDLSALAHGVAERLKRAEPVRRMEFAIEPGLVAEGDAHTLEIALTNLLGNAAKFTSPKPVAHIAFGSTEAPDIETRARRTVFFVRDNGVGFDMAHASKLFGAFQRMHTVSEFPGTGIGLATVQRVVHRHGGRIWAESAPDQGATFYFTLGRG